MLSSNCRCPSRIPINCSDRYRLSSARRYKRLLNGHNAHGKIPINNPVPTSTSGPLNRATPSIQSNPWLGKLPEVCIIISTVSTIPPTAISNPSKLISTNVVRAGGKFFKIHTILLPKRGPCRKG